MAGPVSLSQKASTPWCRAVIYGPSGAGKTVFCCASQQFNTFVFDVDDGTESAAAFKGDPQYGTRATRKDNVVVWRVASGADFDAAWTWYQQNAASFQLVVIDTATELQRLLLGEICRKFRKVVPDQQCWGEILVTMENIARQMRHLNAHIIWTCHEKGYEDKDSGRTTWRPNWSGDFAIQYAKHFGLIARYCVQDQEVPDPANPQRKIYVPLRALNCQKDQVNEVKDRSQGLEKWEAPNIDAVINKWTTAIAANGGSLSAESE